MDTNYGLTQHALLRLSGIVKQYPGCLANDEVDLVVGHNEIHALLGENGAGKSTLVKIIYGVVRPDRGEMRWQGQPVIVENPGQARRLGIGMVFQHFSLFESMTVVENIALGIDGKANRHGLQDRIVEISEAYGLPLDPGQVVQDLSVGERQRIEIVRCLLQKPKLLIMDEPTSVLTPQEAKELFTVLRRLQSEGCSVLYISHKLDEVRALCETATIMRLGRVVAHCAPQEKTTRQLAELMISAELKPRSTRRISGRTAQPRLVVSQLSTNTTQQFGTDLKNLNLSVASGEILGIAGIAGNGQSELMEALSGEAPAARPETIMLEGVAVGHLGPQARRRLGGCFVPEERNGHGAVMGMTLAENGFLSNHMIGLLSRFGLVDHVRTAGFARSVIQRFDVRTTGPEAKAQSLSGGNLQKFLVGREVQQKPTVLVISQPTWGVDAGAAVTIHDAIMHLAENGTAVVIISQDLDEIMSLCDRIAVIAGGKLSASVDIKAATVEQIGLLMGGARMAAAPAVV